MGPLRSIQPAPARPPPPRAAAALAICAPELRDSVGPRRSIPSAAAEAHGYPRAAHIRPMHLHNTPAARLAGVRLLPILTNEYSGNPVPERHFSWDKISPYTKIRAESCPSAPADRKLCLVRDLPP